MDLTGIAARMQAVPEENDEAVVAMWYGHCAGRLSELMRPENQTPRDRELGWPISGDDMALALAKAGVV